MNKLMKNTAIGLALLIGFALGVAASHSTTFAWGETPAGANRLPVPSAARQSFAVLERMASTLQSIDARLARVEVTLQRIADHPAKE